MAKEAKVPANTTNSDAGGIVAEILIFGIYAAMTIGSFVAVYVRGIPPFG